MATIKLTTEARKHLITKTACETRANVLTIDLTDNGKQSYIPYTVSGSFNTDLEALAYISARYTTSEKPVAPVTNAPVEKIEKRFAMFDFDFVRYGNLLTEDSKKVGLMVRTIDFYSVPVICADFDKQEFTKTTVTVCGVFENAVSALEWYASNHPENKAYRVDKEREAKGYQLQYGMNPQSFFDNAFALTE